MKLFAHYVAATKKRPGEVRITESNRPVGGSVFYLGQTDCKAKARALAARFNALCWNF